MKNPRILLIAAAVLILIVIVIIISVIGSVVSNTKPNSSNNVGATQTIDPTAEPEVQQVDVCSILTLEIAEKVMNAKLVKDSDLDQNTCSYKTAEIDSGDVSIVTLMLTQTTNDFAKEQFESQKSEAFNESDIEMINDLNADAAYWSKTFYLLNILKGNKNITISAITIKNPDSKGLSVEVAKLILEKI